MRQRLYTWIIDCPSRLSTILVMSAQYDTDERALLCDAFGECNLLRTCIQQLLLDENTAVGV
jgi:hypothetical protein